MPVPYRDMLAFVVFWDLKFFFCLCTATASRYDTRATTKTFVVSPLSSQAEAKLRLNNRTNTNKTALYFQLFRISDTATTYRCAFTERARHISSIQCEYYRTVEPQILAVSYPLPLLTICAHLHFFSPLNSSPLSHVSNI